MKRIWRRILASVSLTVFVPSFASAQTNCDGDLTPFDSVYCYQKLFVQADKDLNDVYGKLMKALPASGQTRLRAYQRAWIQRRDAQSVFTREGFTYVSLDRSTDMTVARANELNDRLRECLSSGCLISRLK